MRKLLCLAPVLLAACGSPDVVGIDLPNGAPTGSFDVTFTAVAFTASQGSFGSGDIASSTATKARIDLTKRDDGRLDAVFTPRWGEAQALSAHIEGNALVLDADAVVKSSGLTDTWKSMRFAMSGRSLTGSFVATGESLQVFGDIVGTGSSSAIGTIVPDATRPELKAELGSPTGPSGVLLPWDSFTVHAAEGVDDAGFARAFALRSDDGVTFPVSWSADGMTLEGRLRSWDVDGKAIRLLQTSPVTDPAGLAALPLGSSVYFLNLGPAQAKIAFDSDTIVLASWGPVATTPANDPRCESGACAVMGPFTNSVCGGSRVGFAGRLLTGGKRSMIVRYRLLAPDANVFPGPAALSVDVAVPGAKPQTSQTPSGLALEPLPVAIGPLAAATAWSSTRVPLPEGAQEIGFALRVGPGAETCFGGPMPRSTQAGVIVQAITLE